MDVSFWGIPLIVWFVVCLAVAVAYYVVWPKPREGAPARPFWLHGILRWFHSLVWALLALACVAGMAISSQAAKPVALSALAVYIVFMLAFLVDRVKK